MGLVRVFRPVKGITIATLTLIVVAFSLPPSFALIPTPARGVSTSQSIIRGKRCVHLSEPDAELNELEGPDPFGHFSLMVSARQEARILISSTSRNRKWPGSGTAGDPYRIEDLILNGIGNGSGISIEDSSAHYLIRNCTINHFSFGIFLHSAYNCQIINNSMTNIGNGIHTAYCDDLLIQNNIITNTNYSAIFVFNCRDLTIQQNNCTHSDYCGVFLEADGPYELSNNYMAYNDIGLALLGDSYQHDPYANVTGNTCTNNQRVGISISQYVKLNLWNNTCNHNLASGIIIEGSDYHNLANNTCYNNGENGITLSFSGDIQVLNNNCTGNDTGIQISDRSKRNVIWMNTFEANGENGRDDGQSNSFQLNYWSDYTGMDRNNDGIGDVPYPIPGEANNQDALPVMSPPLGTTILFLVHQRNLYTSYLIVGTLSAITILLVGVLLFLLYQRRKKTQ